MRGALSEALAKGLKPFHRQATATTSAVEYALEKGARAIKLVNRSPSKKLLYSIDNGTTFHQVQALDFIDEAFDCTTIQIKAQSSTAPFDFHAALTQ